MSTDTATVDLKAGVAAGADMVHAEGPFGTLDAQGFTLTDKRQRDPVLRARPPGSQQRQRPGG